MVKETGDRLIYTGLMLAEELLYRSRRWLPRRSRSAKKHGIKGKVRWQNTFFNLLFHSAECFLGSRVLTHEGSVPSACQQVSTWRGACLNPPRSGGGTALHTGGESSSVSTHMQANLRTVSLKLRFFFFTISPTFQPPFTECFFGWKCKTSILAVHFKSCLKTEVYKEGIQWREF